MRKRVASADLEPVATVYFALDLHLNYGWMRERVTALPADTHWQTLARRVIGVEIAAACKVYCLTSPNR